jgi:hypothetical protein
MTRAVLISSHFSNCDVRKKFTDWWLLWGLEGNRRVPLHNSTLECEGGNLYEISTCRSAKVVIQYPKSSFRITTRFS